MHRTTSFSRPAVWGRYIARLFGVVALSVGLAACGGDDNDSSTEPPPPPPPPPAAVIHCAP